MNLQIRELPIQMGTSSIRIYFGAPRMTDDEGTADDDCLMIGLFCCCMIGRLVSNIGRTIASA